MTDDYVPRDKRKTTQKDFEPDQTYHTARNIGREYLSQLLAEYELKLPYPKKVPAKKHSARTSR